MKINYKSQLCSAVRAITIADYLNISWLGVPILNPIPDHAREAVGQPALASQCELLIKDHLYQHFYVLGKVFPQRIQHSLSTITSHSFIAAISQALKDEISLDAGWRIDALDATGATLERGGFRLRVPQINLTSVHGLKQDAASDQVALRVPSVRPKLMPGFVVIRGKHPKSNSGTTVRIYLALLPQRASDLIVALVRDLNKRGLGFHLKFVNDPSHFRRNDALVLYFDRNNFSDIASSLSEILLKFPFSLRSGVPAFTKLLAPGVGLAEDPGGNESFGMTRCGLIAAGLVNAWDSGSTSLVSRTSNVLETFRLAGIHIAAPYLNSGSNDIYSKLSFSKKPTIEAKPVPSVPRESDYLQAADQIGRLLCARAVRWGGRATWISEAFARSDTPMSEGVVDGTLYSGTAGIALFLGELYSATNDSRFLVTAREALRHSFDCCSDQVRGVFVGALGTAYAALRLGIGLQCEELTSSAKTLFRRVAAISECGGYDWISGNSGAVVVYLRAYAHLHNERLLDFAMELADELVSTSVFDGRTRSWQREGGPALVGIGHGASGPFVAFNEIDHALGETRYRMIASQAAAFERDWLNRALSNWADLRDARIFHNRVYGENFSLGWCHGAPGIALGRLRAIELSGGSDDDRTDARIALRATLSSLNRDVSNYCLCHGTLGNAEIARYGADLGYCEQKPTKVIELIHRQGWENYVDNPLRWPCGTSGKLVPGLMTGLSGIGLAFLRRVTRTIPSVLLLQVG